MAPNFTHILLLVVPFAFLLLQDYVVSAMECGRTFSSLLSGTETVKWPFHVAIQKRSNYICGGTIISNRHILTAAHCIQQKYSENTLLPHEIVVRLGAYNLTDTNEKGVIQRNVSEIFLHPDWDVFETNFDANIAILVLSENVTFTDDIQPVCMPADDGVIENMEGSVIAYGVGRPNTYAKVAKRIIVRGVSISRCILEDVTIATYASNRTFCGSGNADESLHRGDAGSGYFLSSGSSWTQHGILIALRTNATGHVLTRAHHMYTDVSMFTDWIHETVKQTGGDVSEAGSR